jgi:predicted phosphodiesterase
VRVAALYDIHGNLHALDAVLAEVNADLVLVGGDAVAGPWPSETLECLRELGDGVRFIRGNADREVASELPGLAPPAVMNFVRKQLTEEQIAFLGTWPLTESIDVDGLGPVLFCHATPRSDDEILTRISAEERWQVALASVDEPTVVCGHTHVQFDRLIGETRVVNSGSVGMPYEDEPGAYWTVLGPEVEFRRTQYKAGDIQATGWPEELPTATPEEATDFFEGLSLGQA